MATASALTLSLASYPADELNAAMAHARRKFANESSMLLRTRGGFLNLKSKFHLSFTNVPHAVMSETQVQL